MAALATTRVSRVGSGSFRTRVEVQNGTKRTLIDTWVTARPVSAMSCITAAASRPSVILDIGAVRQVRP